MITSLENEKIKRIVKLHSKKYRDQFGRYLVDGEHLIKEAYKNGLLEEIFLLENSQIDIDIDKTFVSEQVMKKISPLDSVPNMIGVCHKKKEKNELGNHILILDEIQDPGNLGTIIRSAVAFNVDTIVLSLNTVDLYNSKVLRASQGMFAYINIIRRDTNKIIKEIKELNIPVYGTNVVDGYDVKKIESKDKFCLVMGNEGQGLRKEIQELCDKNLYIPMNKNVESLNVGVACSILLYELGGEHE